MSFKIVTTRLGGRFPSSYGYENFTNVKIHNLKSAGTRPDVPFCTSGNTSLNSGFSFFSFLVCMAVDGQLVTRDMQPVFNAFYSSPRGCRIGRFHHKYNIFLQSISMTKVLLWWL